MSRKIDIVSGKLLPTMIRFSIPLVLSSVLQTLYNAADSLIVGRFDGANALGAVGSVSPLVNIFVQIFMGFTIGTNVTVARYRGAENEKMVKKTSDTAIVTGLVSGIILGILGFFMAGPLARIVKIDPEIIDMSILYMKIYFIGMPFVSLYNFISATMRGIGDTKNPMISLVVSGAANVVMNIIFVKYFRMGVAGVAWATVLSQLLGLIMLTVMLKKSEVGLKIRRICFDKRIFWVMTKIGLPAGIQGITFSLSNSISISAINSFGAAAAAGNAVMTQVDGILYVAVNSISQTVTTFVSQYIGAGKLKKIGKVMANGFLIASLLSISMTALAYAFRYPIIDMFAPGDSAVAAAAIVKANFAILPYFIIVLMEIPAGMLRGMGATFVSMLGSILGVCGVRWIWLLVFFPRIKTLEFVYLCYPVSWIITGAVLMIIYFPLKKHMEKEMYS